jgi:hypothetical protein
LLLWLAALQQQSLNLLFQQRQIVLDGVSDDLQIHKEKMPSGSDTIK